jgi:PAS domain S-box-containing protein
VIPSEELQHFLDDLDDRRQRLLRLTGPAGADAMAMRDELAELSERLMVADEELRVQQEELHQTRTVADSVSRGYADLVDSAADALVLTDENGAVLRSSRAARRLTGQGPSAALRPIATWFQVTDRAAVRAAISAAKRPGGGTVELGGMTVRKANGSQTGVLVTATVAVRLSERHSRLLWRLTPLESARPDLRVVPDDGAHEETDHGTDDVERLTDVIIRLSRADCLDDVLVAIADGARSYVPSVVFADVYLSDRQAAERRSGDSSLRHLNELQRGLGEGPALDALAGQEISSPDLQVDLRWPRLGTVVPTVLRAAMAFGLPVDGRPIGALTLVSDRVAGFDEHAERAARIYAVHAGLAVQRVVTEESLRRAMTARQRVGQAVGMLVERYGVDAETAFGLLRQASQATNTKVSRLAEELLRSGRVPDAVGRLARAHHGS